MEPANWELNNLTLLLIYVLKGDESDYIDVSFTSLVLALPCRNVSSFLPEIFFKISNSCAATSVRYISVMIPRISQRLALKETVL